MIKIKEDLYINPDLIKFVYIKAPTLNSLRYTVMIDDMEIYYFTTDKGQPYTESHKKVKEIIKLINDSKTEKLFIHAKNKAIAMGLETEDFYV